MLTDPPHILFNLPTRGEINIECFKGFMSFADFAIDNGIAYDIEFLNGCSIISLGRSMMFSKALTDPNWTHMMWIDDDIGWKPEDVMTLLIHDKDIIGGFYPKREYPIQATFNPLEKGYEDKNLMEIKYLPTGFMMLSRKVCEDMAKKYSHLEFKFGKTKTQKFPYYDVFGTFPYHDPDRPEITEGTNGYYLTEDYAFCQRARDIGYSIYLSKKINLSHTGLHTFKKC